MPLVLWSDRYLDHDTGKHPENATRLSTTLDYLATRPIWSRFEQATPQPASLDAIARVHDRDYIAFIEQKSQAGRVHIEADTVVSTLSYHVARLACGAGIQAVDAVLNGPAAQAVALVRPPGHHALADAPMGFCLFNSIAVAAAHARDHHRLERLLIVDFDVHHGNGTQDIFWRDGQVGFYSMHRYPFYPGSGSETETGSGPGLGMTRNLPIGIGTDRHEILARFAATLTDFAAQIRPQLVLLSAGFDAHHDDPVGNLGLNTEDFARLTEIVLATAQEHCEGRLVSLLEGGYHPQRLAESVEQHLLAIGSP